MVVPPELPVAAPGAQEEEPGPGRGRGLQSTAQPVLVASSAPGLCAEAHGSALRWSSSAAPLCRWQSPEQGHLRVGSAPQSSGRHRLDSEDILALN